MTAGVRKRKVVILISGRGSNMESLIRAAREPDCPYEVVGVISNRPQAPGLQKAAAAGIATAVVDHRQFDSREAFEEVLHETLLVFQAELVACAGFMRVLTAMFTERWEGRLLNIHPSLLPLYRGLNTHERALADGVRIHGCTVHFVTADLDGGPIIAQGAVPVLPDDTPETLAARVLAVEHRIYPEALALVASGAVRMENGRVTGEWQADESAWISSPAITCTLPIPGAGG